MKLLTLALLLATSAAAQQPIREVIDENNNAPFLPRNRVWIPLNAIATSSGSKGTVKAIRSYGVGVTPDCENALEGLIRRVNALLDTHNAEAAAFFARYPARNNVPRAMRERHIREAAAAIALVDNYSPFNLTGPTPEGASACMIRQEIVFAPTQLRHLKPAP